MTLTIRNPQDTNRQVTLNALVDTGADMTCLPSVIIRAIGGIPSSTYLVGTLDERRQEVDSYFLEFEISTRKMLIEVLAFGDEVIIGRNLINELVLELNGPAREIKVKE
jgi:predicted aspartyl protease